MRVAMYYNNHDVRLEEMPAPEIGTSEKSGGQDHCPSYIV